LSHLETGGEERKSLRWSFESTYDLVVNEPQIITHKLEDNWNMMKEVIQVILGEEHSSVINASCFFLNF
jgi:hypothetical protein